MRASDHVWFDGRIVEREQASPSVASNCLHLGIAVFDGMMAYRNGDRWNVHRETEHLERFVAGASRMDLDARWSVEQLSRGAHDLLATLPPRTHYLRPIAYRCAPEVLFDTDNATPSVCMFAIEAARDLDTPLSCQLSPVQRVSHRAIPVTWKVSGAYANSCHAETEARRAGFDTGLLLDDRGLVAETSTSNVFFVRHGRLLTPRLTGDIFPGITRQVVIEQALRDGIAVEERDIDPSHLEAFNAAFLCGTLSEIRPLSCVGPHAYASAADPTVRGVIDRFRALTHA